MSHPTMLALQLWPKELGDQIILVASGVLLMVFGYQVGRFIGVMFTKRKIAANEQDLFTAQRGFKQLYEQELATAKAESAKLADEVKTLTARVEEYRKKAAGYGGLFNSGGKRADAMYALLLENEALEDALMNQNEKMKQDRADALKETMRSTGYRRVLMSQLMNDDRIKGYVEEILAEGKHLPAPHKSAGDDVELKALPE